ncbi:MAG: Rieske (2Fe-2S) protein [Actinomycetota bacterium]|jgi:nitrite reductase/ring-hydroxylating ferredoxin subunit
MSSDGWEVVLDADALLPSRLRRVELGGQPTLLYRLGDAIFAISNRCTHAGIVLDRAPVQVVGADAILTCPAHGSRFGLRDGKVRRGPATQQLTSYDAREVDGKIELRPRSS